MNHYIEISEIIKRKKVNDQKKETVEEFLQRGGKIQKFERGVYDVYNQKSPWKK